MRINLFFLICLATVAISCNKLPEDNGDPASEAGMITEVISGSRATFTKATIANLDASFKWSIGDKVAVHVSKGDSHKYVVTSGGATTEAATASFAVSYEEGYSRDAFAIFPSNIVEEEATNYGIGSPLAVILPASYHLAEVSEEISPCPMIAGNEPDTDWNFYQLCSLLRLTVNNIPANAKRLVIDFNGKKVSGSFSIASPVTPNTSVIATVADATNDNITITKNGTDVVLGETSLVLNIPLPTGDYNNITVTAYDAVTEGNVILLGAVPFAYSADNTAGVKKATTLSEQSLFTFTFRDADTQTNLNGLRFVRLFSCQNKLYNGSTTYGPFTVSSATGETDIANPVVAALRFGPDDGDQLAFQVIDASGKVYSGSYDAPAGGFTVGEYNLTVDVKAYTFTVASGKKVYFSPGDLGVDNGVYSFTEPFTTWEHGNTTIYNAAANQPAKRVWFDMHLENAVITGGSVYGITNWRSPIKVGSDVSSYEWNYLVNSRTMNSDVARYYKVTISGHQYCLLLPPDETVLTSGEKTELEGGNLGDDYVKYLGKGFVLLFNTNRATYSNSKWKWGSATSLYAKQGWYWTINDGSNRYYFTWPDAGPKVDWEATRQRDHIRYVRDVQ